MIDYQNSSAKIYVKITNIYGWLFQQKQFLQCILNVWLFFKWINAINNPRISLDIGGGRLSKEVGEAAACGCEPFVPILFLLLRGTSYRICCCSAIISSAPPAGGDFECCSGLLLLQCQYSFVVHLVALLLVFMLLYESVEVNASLFCEFDPFTVINVDILSITWNTLISLKLILDLKVSVKKHYERNFYRNKLLASSFSSK